MTSDEGERRQHDQREHRSDEDVEDPGWPWSFLLLVAAGGIYLILRFVQLAAKLLT